MPAQDRPTVSAVFISNRSDDALAGAVRSVVEQDHRPAEIVIFGNGAAVEAPAPARESGVAVVTGTSAENLGVAGGRNAAAALASGDWLLFLDDDAVLRPGAVRSAIGTAASQPSVGAVVFSVVDPDSGAPVIWYYPRDRAVWSERVFEATHLLGGGNLIRRDLFERLGGFWDGYFREMEEVDFSWRLMDEGYRVLYDPGAAFEHPERTSRLYAHSLPSILIMLWRLLPAPLALRQTAVKLPLFAARALRHGELRDLLAGLRRAAGLVPRLRRERAPLAPSTVAHLRRMHAAGGLGGRIQWSLRKPEPLD